MLPTGNLLLAWAQVRISPVTIFFFSWVCLFMIDSLAYPTLYVISNDLGWWEDHFSHLFSDILQTSITSAHTSESMSISNMSVSRHVCLSKSRPCLGFCFIMILQSEIKTVFRPPCGLKKEPKSAFGTNQIHIFLAELLYEKEIKDISLVVPIQGLWM